VKVPLPLYSVACGPSEIATVAVVEPAATVSEAGIALADVYIRLAAIPPHAHEGIPTQAVGVSEYVDCSGTFMPPAGACPVSVTVRLTVCAAEVDMMRFGLLNASAARRGACTVNWVLTPGRPGAESFAAVTFTAVSAVSGGQTS